MRTRHEDHAGRALTARQCFSACLNLGDQRIHVGGEIGPKRHFDELGAPELGIQRIEREIGFDREHARAHACQLNQ